MRGPLLGLAAALALTVRIGAADDKPKAAAPKPAAPAVAAGEVQDLVFLADTRPVRIRLRIQIDGKPFRAAWDEYVKKLFEDLDLNKDGVLSPKEAERAPSVLFLTYHYQGVIGVDLGKGNHAPFAELDTNPRDSKVTLEELAGYYRRSGLGSLQLGIGPDQGISGRLTESLFQMLDLNQDGKLCKEEMAVAGLSLHKLDLDEDEVITAEEVDSSLTGFNFQFQQRSPTRQNGPAALDKAGFVLLLSGEPPARVIGQIISRYDKDKNHKLSRAEIGLDKSEFDALDVNKDGFLDSAELAKWLAQDADIEMIARLGTVAPAQTTNLFGQLAAQLGQKLGPGIEVVKPAGKTGPFAAAIRKDNQNALLLNLGDAQIDTRRHEGQTNAIGAVQFYLNQFRMALGKKKYLEKKDIQGSYYLRGLFDLADRDADGKLYEKELSSFFNLHSRGASSFVTFAVTEFGRGLFELLDANHDGRLGQRELRSSWTRLSPYARSGGLVARADLPRRLQLLLGQGQIYLYGRFGSNSGMPNYGGGMPALFSTSGPLWFRKMDRNGDGDVSPREFLGSAEDFQRIDTDGDGLIDALEAEQTDSWFKKRVQKEQ